MIGSGDNMQHPSPDLPCSSCLGHHGPSESHVSSETVHVPESEAPASLGHHSTLPYPQPGGRYFEGFTVGDSFETASRTITEADVDTFATLTGDHNPLHVDGAFAAQSRWGGRIAHGLCTLSMASGLFSSLGLIAGTAEAFLSMDTQFHDVVRPGDTIRVVTRVLRKRELPGQEAGVVAFEAQTYNQQGRMVQRGTWSAIIRKSPAASTPPA